MFDLETAKKRAEEYLNRDDYSNGLASFLSDLNKIPGKDYSTVQDMAALLLMGGHLDTTEKVRKFIQGTN